MSSAPAPQQTSAMNASVPRLGANRPIMNGPISFGQGPLGPGSRAQPNAPASTRDDLRRLVEQKRILSTTFSRMQRQIEEVNAQLTHHGPSLEDVDIAMDKEMNASRASYEQDCAKQLATYHRELEKHTKIVEAVERERDTLRSELDTTRSGSLRNEREQKELAAKATQRADASEKEIRNLKERNDKLSKDLLAKETQLKHMKSCLTSFSDQVPQSLCV
jgi:hypothetical protein